MDEVARRHPNLVKLQDLGKSFEGRRMKLAKISAQPDAGNPVIFVDAGRYFILDHKGLTLPKVD